ncbi:uncharacterized protein KY384_001180 [Bacidia gigantensis]|uniref:uncharacterized protein n=1 Tax=Bacidia gigantensis TaxID=2732470 RepID=UPI001D04443C|nr:uncharacterized protein KY384_001180 [Bacidia gigantensis]KAG8534336.1 hypothetical protein KY384_001180 [Bacidia gigantensis]
MIAPAVSTIGAGLSGLALGLSLKSKGISGKIYDLAPGIPRFNYGITLHASTYRPLLGLLKMDEATFRKETAVDGARGEPVIWKDRTHLVKFERGLGFKTRCLAGCDGINSSVSRSLMHKVDADVHPFVAFSGRRRVPTDVFVKVFGQSMAENVMIVHHNGAARLEITISDMTSEYVILGYIYSRQTRSQGSTKDPLHTPLRPSPGAKLTPPALYDEIEALGNLPQPFNTIFHAESMRNDRLLHWLLRSRRPQIDHSKQLADRGAFIIGDAAHGAPLLGGEGANMAITDGIDLAEHIAKRGVDTAAGFSNSKYESWIKFVDESVQRLRDMHNPGGRRH